MYYTKNLVVSKKKLKMPNSFIFQQDNAPCHRANPLQIGWKDARKTLQWPPKSPDLNPIENLWSWLDGKLAKEELSTLQDLTAAINRILSNVPDHLIKNLVESMPNRIHESLKAHGGITNICLHFLFYYEYFCQTFFTYIFYYSFLIKYFKKIFYIF